MNTTTTSTAKNANQKQISALNMRVIDTEIVGRKNKTTLRKFFKTNYNLKTFNDLMAFVIAFGVDIGKRKKTQEKRTFQYLAEIYNDDVRASQKKKRAIKKQTKKAVGKYVNIVIEFKAFNVINQAEKGKVRQEFRNNYNPLEKGKGGRFTDPELKLIKQDNSINKVRAIVIKTKDDVVENVEIDTTKTFYTDEIIYVEGYALKPSITNEYYLHSKNPVVDVNKWIKEKLDKVLVFGFQQSPHDWCEVKLIKKNLLTIKKPKNPRSLPIKQAGSLDLDHHTLKNEEWDKMRDMCVVDFILWKYGQRKGFIKPLKTNKGTQQEQDEAVEYYSTYHDTLSYHNDGMETNIELKNNPNETGYTIDHIEQFCKNFEINMICLIDGVIKYHYTSEGAKKNPAFVFEMKNNHLYPICDTNTIQKYTKQVRNIKSNTLQVGVKKDEETKEGKEDKKINVFKDTTIKHNTKIEYAIKMMERENTQTNYPTDLKLSNNVLSNFELNGKRFLFNEEDNE